MTALFSLFSAVMPGMLIVTVLGLLTTKIPPRAATACILACITGTMLSIFIPDIFVRPFVLLCGAPYPSAGAGYFNNLAGLVWGVVALLIFWPFAKPKSKEECLGFVWNFPPTRVMRELYVYALHQGKRGVVELTTDEIMKNVSELKKRETIEYEKEVRRIRKQIKVKEVDHKDAVYMGKDAMEALGVVEVDLVILQKGLTGLSSIRAIAKEESQLEGKNDVVISRELCNKAGFKDGDAIRIITFV